MSVRLKSVNSLQRGAVHLVLGWISFGIQVDFFERSERRLFLMEKPVECMLSVYSNSETDVAADNKDSPYGGRVMRKLVVAGIVIGTIASRRCMGAYGKGAGPGEYQRVRSRSRDPARDHG